MSRPFIVLGDKTDHGGAVTAGSPFTDIDGKPVARQGDPVSCPNCGPTMIASGDATAIIDGKPVARHGDKTACGATLIAGQARVAVDAGGGSSPAATNIGAAAPVEGARTPLSHAQKAQRPNAGTSQLSLVAPLNDATSQPVTTGLGDSVDSLVSKSPTLQSDLQKLEADDWEIRYGAPGEGSYVDRQSDPRVIVIDGSTQSNTSRAGRALAHETGHALYGYTSDYSSKAAYVDGALADEGAGTLYGIQVQREIRSNGGPDIGLSGSAANHPAYNAAYDQFVKDGDALKARRTIGKIYGSQEKSSIKVEGKQVSYSDYYGTWYDQHFGP